MSCRRVEVGCLHSTGRGRFLGAAGMTSAERPPNRRHAQPADHHDHHDWRPLRPGQGGAPGRRQGCYSHGANQRRCCPASARSDDIAGAPHASQPSPVTAKLFTGRCPLHAPPTSAWRRMEPRRTDTSKPAFMLPFPTAARNSSPWLLARPALVADALLSEPHHVESLARRMQVVSCKAFREGTCMQQ